VEQADMGMTDNGMDKKQIEKKKGTQTNSLLTFLFYHDISNLPRHVIKIMHYR
jgi:hypothetical protein